MDSAPDDLRRRRVGLALIALTLVLFVAEMVAIALGRLEVAGLIFLIFAAADVLPDRLCSDTAD